MKKKAIKCCVCGKESTGGYFNAPKGAHCPTCWARVPKAERKTELRIALAELAALGKNIQL